MQSVVERQETGLAASAASAAVVELSGVRKSFGAVEALRGMTLAIGPGEVVALLGPNGAGKTTALAVMLGLRRPTAGRARLFGLDPTDRRARSRVGVMLQESGVPGTLTVRELVDLFRSYYPAPLPARRALELAGVERLAGARAATLSGGERQRLHFALAICGDPDALFLDEPTIGMDVAARRAFLDGVRSLAGAGRAIVLTTHYLEEADQLARRVVVIDRGGVVADAAPGTIKARVTSRRVTFTAPGPVAAPLFADLPVAGLEIAGRRVRLLTSEPEQVLRALFERGLGIRDLEVAGAGLEEAFLALTRREEARS